MIKRKHIATGRPRGRPSTLPYDIGRRIINNLKQRVDPETGLVRPSWGTLVQELGVSRSTIARQLAILRERNYFETIVSNENPNKPIVYYKLRCNN